MEVVGLKIHLTARSKGCNSFDGGIFTTPGEDDRSCSPVRRQTVGVNQTKPPHIKKINKKHRKRGEITVQWEFVEIEKSIHCNSQHRQPYSKKVIGSIPRKKPFLVLPLPRIAGRGQRAGEIWVGWRERNLGERRRFPVLSDLIPHQRDTTEERGFYEKNKYIKKQLQKKTRSIPVILVSSGRQTKQIISSPSF